MSSYRVKLLVLLAICLLVITLFFRKEQSLRSYFSNKVNRVDKVASAPPAGIGIDQTSNIEALKNRLPVKREEFLDVAFANDYGRSGNANKDLQIFQNLLLNFRLLVKDHPRIPFSGNDGFIWVLAGGNHHRLALLEYDHPFIGDKGELLDRWKTPILFHQVSSDETTLRSAGPDRVMWTNDDIVNGGGAY